MAVSVTVTTSVEVKSVNRVDVESVHVRVDTKLTSVKVVAGTVRYEVGVEV